MAKFMPFEAHPKWQSNGRSIPKTTKMLVGFYQTIYTYVYIYINHMKLFIDYVYIYPSLKFHQLDFPEGDFQY